jgi:ATP-dependent protease ClpP protease subunit
MADKNQRAHARAVLNAAALLDEADGADAGSNTVTIRSKMPRIKIEPRMECVTSAPPSDKVLERWQVGIRSAIQTADVNVIQMFDVIGYDYWTGGGITAQTTSDQLKSFNGQDCEVHINSPGGDMFEGIAIYNLLQQYEGKVTVKIMALAASAASIIAMAGDEIQIGQGAFEMIHNAWVVAMGNRNDFLEVAAYLEPFDQAIAGIYAARTGQKLSDITQWMDDETFFAADRAIALGFADKMLNADEITESADAASQARAQNAVRKIESLLTKQGNMSRSKARALITELKTGKQDAADVSNSGMPGAAANATLDAGNDWLTAALALAKSLLKK